jgi:hypothetical protein
VKTLGYSNQNEITPIRKWWTSRRPKYNKALAISWLISLVIYNGSVFTLDILFSQPDPDALFDWRFKIYFILLQLIGCLFVIGAANLLYSLGWLFDRRYNDKNTDTFRQKLFSIGYWTSISIPLLISICLTTNYILNIN